MLANDFAALNKTYKEVDFEVPEEWVAQVTEEVQEDGEKKEVTRYDMEKVAKALKAKGLIEYDWFFRLFAGHLLHVVVGDLLDRAVLLLLLVHAADIRLGDLDAGLQRGLVERSEVVGQHPAHRRADGGGGGYDHHPEQDRQQGIGAFFLPFLLFLHLRSL